MEHSDIRIENLSVFYPSDKTKIQAVKDVSFSLERGSSLGIIGESGSGKTSIAMAIMGLLKKPAHVNGQIYYGETDLNSLSEKERNYYRWGKIAIVFQKSLDVLNPVLTIHEQIFECICRHTTLTVQEANKKVLQLLEMVGLEAEWNKYYPHQLSGGMQQRVLLAMALSCDPEVLIVDEPTSALDSSAKDEVTALIARLHRERKFALVVISHEMHIIKSLTNRVMVMYLGHMIEEGFTKDVIKNPMHIYTRGLVNASPAINPYRDLWGIPGLAKRNSFGGCPFYNRCNQRVLECKTKLPQLGYISMERRVACNRAGITTLLTGKGICKNYLFKGKVVKACVDCDIEIHSGEVVVLIGESGSGKTTLAGILSGALSADKGEIVFEGEKVKGNSATSRKNGMQIVFQDTFTSINEHLTIAQAVSEPLEILKLDTREERNRKVKQVLMQVQLSHDYQFLRKNCHSLSGGQRQRIAIARSLVLEPKLLIADEISSMLDPSTQANILRLLKGLQNSIGFAMLYITHDLALARKIADKIYVMHKGRIIEHGSAADIFDAPRESYTRKLVSDLR